MYKILLAIDGSLHSQKAIEESIRLASLLKAKVTVLSVAENTPIYHYGTELGSVPIQQEMVEERLKASQEILTKCKESFAEQDLEIDSLSKEGPPAETICKVAEEEGYDLIMIGSRGLGGLRQLFLGSVSNKVVNQSKISVLVVK